MTCSAYFYNCYVDAVPQINLSTTLISNSVFAELCFECDSNHLKNRDVNANLSGDGTEEGGEGEG